MLIVCEQDAVGAYVGVVVLSAGEVCYVYEGYVGSVVVLRI